MTYSKSLVRSVLLVSALTFGGASAFAATDTSSVPAATKSDTTTKTAKVHHKKSHKQTAAVTETKAQTQAPSATQPQAQTPAKTEMPASSSK